jgi:hypothetical protein
MKNSRYGMEISLRQQRLYEAHQWCDKRRIRPATPVPYQSRDPKPRCTGTLQMEKE